MTTSDLFGGGLTVREELRSFLASTWDNYLLSQDFAIQAQEFCSVYNLVGLEGNIDGQGLRVSSYYNDATDMDNPAGGGYFLWDSTKSRSYHNGVTIISPTAQWNGSQSTLSDFITGANETEPGELGCWVRQYSNLDVMMGGAVSDGTTSDLVAFQAVVDALPDSGSHVIHVPAGSYAGTLSSINVGNRRIVWLEQGVVTYVSSNPTGYREPLATVNLNNISQLYGFTGSAHSQRVEVANYYPWTSLPTRLKGGGSFFWDSSQAKSNHNGVTIFSPTVPWDGTSGTLEAYISKTGETDPSGTGCWVRQFAVLDVFMAGAVGDAVADDLAAFRAASGTGVGCFYAPRPSGKYRFSDILTLQNGQLMYGDGVTKSIIYVDATFNLSALGVVRLGTAEPGAQIDKIGIEFVQTTAASTGSRADLIAYPWAIYAVDASRFRIGDLRVSSGYNGINMNGNTGGAVVGHVELGCFNLNIDMDGAMDFVKFGFIHIWPFGFAGTANLTSIFYDGNTYGFRSGNVDGLAINTLAMFRVKAEFTGSGPTDILPFIINSLQLDGDGARLIWNEGRGLIGNLYSSKTTTPTDPSIAVTGGKLNIGVASISGGESVCINVTGGWCQINGGELFNNSLSKQGATVSAGTLELNNVALNWAAGTRTTPFLEQSATGVLRVNDARPVVLSPASEVIKFNTDVAGNEVNGETLKPHTITFPSTLTSGTYSSKVLSGDISVTFATPGDLSVAYGVVRTAYWSYSHGFGHINYRFTFTPTFTTSSGNLVLSLAGFASSLTQASEIEVTGYSGITMTGGRTKLMARISSTGEIILFEYSPTVALRQLSAANFTTATAVSFFFSGSFLL